MRVEAKTRFIVVRHADTDIKKNGSIAGGLSDLPLSQKGRKEAGQLVEDLRNVPIHGIYSSDMQRAYATAEPVAKSKGLDIVSTPLLRERVYGKDIEGEKKDWEAKAILDELFTFWGSEHHDRKTIRLVEDMETDKEVMDRFIPFFHETAKKHPNETVLLMTHCDAMSTFLQTAVTPKNELYNPATTGQIIVDFTDERFDLVGMKNVKRFL